MPIFLEENSTQFTINLASFPPLTLAATNHPKQCTDGNNNQSYRIDKYSHDGRVNRYSITQFPSLQIASCLSVCQRAYVSFEVKGTQSCPRFGTIHKHDRAETTTKKQPNINREWTRNDGKRVTTSKGNSRNQTEMNLERQFTVLTCQVGLFI